MLAAGTTLGRYKILAPLGEGGMGEVYHGHDPRLAREVAIKVVRGDFARDPERLKRFEQEARAAGALNHPNVCTIYDVGTHEGAPFVVMELLEGESLRAKLEAGPLPLRKALEYAAQAAHGLAAAHAKGIVHRDLKPENLFVTSDGRVKVLDFGLAKLVRPEMPASAGDATVSVALSESGAIVGTAGYMAPEQLRGQPVDARTDLFALGAVAHELVSGQRAFKGASFIETAAAILNWRAPALRRTPESPAHQRFASGCANRGSEALEDFRGARPRWSLFLRSRDHARLPWLCLHLHARSRRPLPGDGPQVRRRHPSSGPSSSRRMAKRTRTIPSGPFLTFTLSRG
jgi:serine/threonine protein kinase